MRVQGYIILGLLFVISLGFQKPDAVGKLNGTWNIIEIRLNSNESTTDDQAILKFLKKSNPTTIKFDITNTEGKYEIFSEETLLEESNISLSKNKLCKNGITDCALVEIKDSKCQLIFDKFTYFLSR